jgi:hypothetical protein
LRWRNIFQFISTGKTLSMPSNGSSILGIEKMVQMVQSLLLLVWHMVGLQWCQEQWGATTSVEGTVEGFGLGQHGRHLPLQCPKANREGPTSSTLCWKPPTPGYISVNVDATLFPVDPRMEWGVVLRDCHGSCILYVSEGLEGFPTPELTRALVVGRALTVARDHSILKVVVVCL